jgi:hypothetical protein
VNLDVNEPGKQVSQPALQPGEGIPAGFELRRDGLYRAVEGKEGMEWRRVCSPLEIIALCRNDGTDWGRLARFPDPDGKFTHGPCRWKCSPATAPRCVPASSSRGCSSSQATTLKKVSQRTSCRADHDSGQRPFDDRAGTMRVSSCQTRRSDVATRLWSFKAARRSIMRFAFEVPLTIGANTSARDAPTIPASLSGVLRIRRNDDLPRQRAERRH